MPEMKLESSTEVELSRVRRERIMLERRLAAISAYEQQLTSIIEDEKADALIQDLPPASLFDKREDPIQSIYKYLEWHKHPRTRRDIAQTLVKLDAITGDNDGRKIKSVYQSITFHVRHQKTLQEPRHDHNARKQNPDNLIGMSDWPDKKFQLS